MPTVQVDKARPVLVSLGSGRSDVVENIGSSTVYYKAGAAGAAVSSTEKDGELAATESLTIEQGTYFIAKEGGGLLRQLPAVAEEQAAGDIAKESITPAKIAAKAVTSAKANPPSVPVASGTESLTAEVGTAGVVRSVIAVYNAKKEASAKVKIKHGLNSEYVAITAWKASAKKASERITDGAAVAGAISKVKCESAEEVLVTLVATEPAEKEELFYIIHA